MTQEQTAELLNLLTRIDNILFFIAAIVHVAFMVHLGNNNPYKKFLIMVSMLWLIFIVIQRGFTIN